MTLSVDNVVLDFTITRESIRDRLMNKLKTLAMQRPGMVIHWDSTKIGTFRNQFSIRCTEETSFWVGVALNSAKTLWERCRMDFNPNKVGNVAVFQDILKFLLENTLPIQRGIRRFDLAIDIPVDRYDCFLIKDRRMYIERRHGQEFTQYLGAKSSAVGRVKLYNKQTESKLDYPLTRLELTLDPAIPYEKVNFPTVYYADTPEICIDGGRVTDTEMFILNALLQGYGSMNDLGRKTRVKMEGLMKKYLKRVEVSSEDYAAILSQLQAYAGKISC